MAKDTKNGTAPRRQATTDRVAASARGAVKVYGDGAGAVRALDGVDVDFEGGRFTAIMGPSGSGKSTLMHCIAGLDRLTLGKVKVGAVELSTLSDDELAVLRREAIGFVFQSFNLLPTLTAKENILLPLALAGEKPAEAWFDEVILTMGLGDRLAHRPSELSGGQQQRVAIARTLVAQPQLIFADEPTGNLDSRASGEILSFLRRVSRELRQTIVMVTHDALAAAYADRVLFLADGKLVDDVDQPSQDQILERIKSLGAEAEVPA